MPRHETRLINDFSISNIQETVFFCLLLDDYLCRQRDKNEAFVDSHLLLIFNNVEKAYL